MEYLELSDDNETEDTDGPRNGPLPLNDLKSLFDSLDFKRYAKEV